MSLSCILGYCKLHINVIDLLLIVGRLARRPKGKHGLNIDSCVLSLWLHHKHIDKPELWAPGEAPVLVFNKSKWCY